MVGVMMVDQQDQLPVVVAVVLVVLDLIILVVLLVTVVEDNILSLELPSIMLLVEAEEQDLAVLLEQEVIA